MKPHDRPGQVPQAVTELVAYWEKAARDYPHGESGFAHMEPTREDYARLVPITRTGCWATNNEVVLITRRFNSPQMEEVWPALQKRKVSLEVFCYECLSSYFSWQAVPKLPTSKRKSVLKSVHTKALRLARALEEAECLHDSSIGRLLQDRDVKLLQSRPGGKFVLGLLYQLPPLPEILRSVAQHAGRELTAAPAAKQVAGIEAHINHFIRRLSLFLRHECNTPLHASVADTTSAIFDLEESIDAARVRLLVSR